MTLKFYFEILITTFKHDFWKILKLKRKFLSFDIFSNFPLQKLIVKFHKKIWSILEKLFKLGVFIEFDNFFSQNFWILIKYAKFKKKRCEFHFFPYKFSIFHQIWPFLLNLSYLTKLYKFGLLYVKFGNSFCETFKFYKTSIQRLPNVYIFCYFLKISLNLETIFRKIFKSWQKITFYETMLKLCVFFQIFQFLQNLRILTKKLANFGQMNQI